MEPKDLLCLALDYDLEEIMTTDGLVVVRTRMSRLLNDLQGLVGTVKFNAAFDLFGWGIVEEAVGLGYRPWTDLKFHDVPRTVFNRTRAHCLMMEKGIVTFHLAGGREVVQEFIRASNPFPGILGLGITLLTSHDLESLNVELGFPGSVSEYVNKMVEIGVWAGAQGFVCSGEEVADLHRRLGAERFLATPGVRLPGGDKQDQKRVVTPGDAVAGGSSLVVAGSELMKGGAEAAKRMLESIQEGMDRGGRRYVVA